MIRLGGFAVPICLSSLVLLGGCAKGDNDGGWAATPPPTTDVSRMTVDPSEYANPTTTLPGGQPAAREAWDTALAMLEDITTITYTVNSQTEASDGKRITRTTVAIDVTEDGYRKEISTELTLRSTTEKRTEVFVITDGDTYRMADDFTGSQKGKWVHSSAEDMSAALGEPVDLTIPTAVPPGVAGFQALEVQEAFGQRQIVGRLPAGEALFLLQIPELSADPKVAKTLSGFVPAVAIVNTDGSLFALEVYGAKHTVRSDGMPDWGDAMIGTTASVLTIEDVDEPVDLGIPSKDEVWNG